MENCIGIDKFHNANTVGKCSMITRADILSWAYQLELAGINSNRMTLFVGNKRINTALIKNINLVNRLFGIKPYKIRIIK